MKVGLLCGREYAFPPAFINKVNTLGKPHGITAEFVTLTGTKMGEPSGASTAISHWNIQVRSRFGGGGSMPSLTRKKVTLQWSGRRRISPCRFRCPDHTRTP